MHYGKLAVSVLFSASLFSFGAAGHVMDMPTALAASAEPLAYNTLNTEGGWSGLWVETVAHRGTISITALERGDCVVRIEWPNGAAEHIVWEMTAGRDGAGRISYEDCTCTVINYSADGSETRTVRYQNGTGSFIMLDDDHITWQDDMENAGQDAVFAYSN